MKVVHLVSDLDEKFGGPSQSVPRLVGHLEEQGVEGEIIYTALEPDMHNEFVSQRELKVTGVPLSFSRNLYYSNTMRSVIRRALNSGVDIMHIHSMWRAPAWQAFTEAQRAGIPHVVSPRSNLYAESLQRSRGVKQIMRHAFVNRMCNQAAFIHVTADSEAEAVREAGFGSTPIVNIPNGLPAIQESDISVAVARKSLGLPEKKGPVLLFLSRVDNRKRVQDLFPAFANVLKRNLGAELVIAGPCSEESYLNHLKSLAATHEIGNAVYFTGMLRGRKKAAAFALADVFVLPSKFENFGIAVGEAMAHGLPVITTTGTPWGFVEPEGGGWITVPGDIEGLSAAITRALETEPAKRKEMGQVAKKIAERYSWRSVAEQMRSAYLSNLRIP